VACDPVLGSEDDRSRARIRSAAVRGGRRARRAGDPAPRL